MSKGKITIKEMKQDHFREVVLEWWGKTLFYLEENWKTLLTAVAAVAVVVLAVGFWKSHTTRKATDARSALAAALESLPSNLQSSPQVDAASDSGDGDLDKAEQELQGVIDEFGGYDSAVLAQYYLSVVRFQKGDAAGALEAADSYLKASPGSPLAPLAHWMRARAFGAQGQVEDALAAFDNAASGESALLSAELARMYKAEYLESAGRLADALAEYQALAESEDGPWKGEADVKVGELQQLLDAES